MNASAVVDSVLVLDDDPQVLRLMCEVLQRAGYPVIGADNLRTAHALSGPFSLIVFDRHLPDGDGWTYAAQWRVRGVRVLCITGSSQAQLPGIPLLRKPFSPSTLIAAVGELIGSPT